MSDALKMLRNVMEGYSPISPTTWQQIVSLCTKSTYKKDQYIYPYGELPNSFAFINRGIVRLFACDHQGHEYNKRFFCAGEFPGIMSALHQKKAVEQGIQCLQNCEVLLINFKAYREVLFDNHELMRFQIKYLEKNWLLEKDQREICLIQQDATERYLLFLQQNASLVEQIPQYHLASHLGISATQLSRIRKSLKTSRSFT
ncbi:Crp/Fnr family transcriptional regulator [Pseudoalteromonas sp. JBTF-M23]|uniref:Crp/Fnr family transcriptional regulator n=1 Tax=Pseudoalteromonas caenipelagi TaxID=2726988 RepID=A0A849VAQ9_9GAMM|nr:Crp/Fnr family transcriptional regulator [Pseudoalteromonas caenipelagi]NOU50366.1 Crp/Fnr family transcriptional regulator [Pseudoalteromonas caenipelagi]